MGPTDKQGCSALMDKTHFISISPSTLSTLKLKKRFLTWRMKFSQPFHCIIAIPLQLNEFTWGDGSRAPGSQLAPMKTGPGCLPIQPTTPPTSLLDNHSGHCSIPASPTYHKMRTSSGDSCRMRNQILGLGEFLSRIHFQVVVIDITRE